ncbi:CAAX amino terminal protease self- immunity [Variovorax sp. SRS16]|uniref:CPBP family intramembrane glutamic endopeptidase n=1 Tax=Variovorax sp. SRS16 TaxID=282217 RepID=UPI0013169A6B|nr:CPBP family intramembrane glutamic endopeptidase [Variovorax sp. SRS16]VTU19870.1 CAAX amino terminal protease self- immunity [Variovorax sp. SRS16]
MLAPHLLLALAIAAVWLPPVPLLGRARIPPWVALFLAALSLAACDGIVTTTAWLAVGLLIALLTGASAASRTDHPVIKAVFETASIVMLFGFAIQLFPGFVGTTVISTVRLSADAVPMRLIARFDVGMAALLLLVLYCTRITSLIELRVVALPTSVVAVLTTVAVVSAALIAGYIRFEPKWPSFALAYLGKTLLLTAVVEEAFFCGVLQERLARSSFFNASRFRSAMPVVISAALFGLAHLPGGWTLAALASLAGFGYALAYALTERIEAPIAVHFLVNATHFIAFTYPQLAVTQ